MSQMLWLFSRTLQPRKRWAETLFTEHLESKWENCSYYLGPSMNYIIFHLDKNGFHLSRLENFSKSLLLEPCMNQAQGFKCRFFRLLPTLIVTKLVKKQNVIDMSTQNMCWYWKKRDKISYNLASMGKIPRFRHRPLTNIVIEIELLSKIRKDDMIETSESRTSFLEIMKL